jgi:hypothetical protein
LAVPGRAQYRDDLAHDGGVIGRDRLERRVVGHQPRVPAAPLQGLDRGLATDPGGDDLAVLGVFLPADHYQVAVDDRRPGHRVAFDPQHEHLSAADQSARQPVHLLGDLGHVRGDAGRDPT